MTHVLSRRHFAAAGLLAALTMASSAARAESVPLMMLPGWDREAHAAAYTVFHRSCRHRIESAPRDSSMAGYALTALCRDLQDRPAVLPHKNARRYFETHFVAEKLTGSNGSGFATAYYEPLFEGRRKRAGSFTTPLYAVPDDLVSVTQANRPAGFPSELTAARRQASGGLEPYPDRSAIMDGALAGKGLELVWMKDPVEAAIIQIQGSGKVRLEDGRIVRLAFGVKNGHPYTAIGRVLVDRGLMTREEADMPRIRALLASRPELADDVLRQNRAYVFFRLEQTKTTDTGPMGAQGLPLTPLRSIAIDPAHHSYGSLFYVSGRIPGGKGQDRLLQHLMVAQDTGSAIRGRARIDIYAGTGKHAEAIAGATKHAIELYVLRPKRAGTR